jgi:hypothetical protein
MKRIITIILLFISMSAFSQIVLLEQDVKSDTLRPTRGPNLKHFLQGYIGIGFPVFTNEEVNYTKFGSSSAIDFGMRYKRKLASHFAVGLDFGVNLAAYKIAQDYGKTVPDTNVNDKEKFQINSLTGSAYTRLNIGRRGNHIGNYVDLGVYGSWNCVKKHKTTNENANGEKVKVVTSQLKYIDNFSYGLLGRIGSNRYALTASYRLSDIFKSTYAIPELPRLIVGLEIGIF